MTATARSLQEGKPLRHGPLASWPHDLLEEPQITGLCCDKRRRREMDASVVRRVRTGVAASRWLGSLFASRRSVCGDDGIVVETSLWGSQRARRGNSRAAAVCE
jgi:hypothetical protein